MPTDHANMPLRDIHLPDPVSWWPPAIGWWLLLLLFCVLAAGGICLWLHYRRGAAKRAAEQELDRIAREFDQYCDLRRLAQSLSALLRRAAISRFPRHEVAALTGRDWLAWLDRQCGGDVFRNGDGQILLTAPYQADPVYDADALIGLCRDCLHKIMLQRGAGHA